jgi:hypothetical protein
MLLLLLYNSVGYYFVFRIQHQKAEKEFQDYINSSIISDEDLTLFKISVVEYASKAGRDFDRVEGDFEQNGKFFEIVKQRLENDTVYVYCINNEKEEALYAQLSDHINTHIVDGKPVKNNKSEKSYKNLLREYLPKAFEVCIDNKSFILISNSKFAYNKTLISAYLSISNPPPEII